MAYQILIKPSASKDLDKIPTNEVHKLLLRIEELGINPCPVGVQKLNDDEGFRIRSGNYRVLFVVDDIHKTIFIYRIKHRKDAYR